MPAAGKIVKSERAALRPLPAGPGLANNLEGAVPSGQVACEVAADRSRRVLDCEGLQPAS
jgi:hypothetical protein